MGLGQRRKKRYVLWAFFLLFFSWLAGFFIFIHMIPNEPEQPERKLSAIVVLTGGAKRLEAGLALLDQNQKAQLFISGVHRGVDVRSLLRTLKRKPGRLECCISLGHQADDTAGNALEVADWVKKTDADSIRLVTANYHMPRSVLELKARMDHTTILRHPVIPEHIKVQEWYYFPDTALFLAVEYTKFLIAFARISLDMK